MKLRREKEKKSLHQKFQMYYQCSSLQWISCFINPFIFQLHVYRRFFGGTNETGDLQYDPLLLWAVEVITHMWGMFIIF